jgi:hypothetical protein
LGQEDVRPRLWELIGAEVERASYRTGVAVEVLRGTSNTAIVKPNLTPRPHIWAVDVLGACGILDAT